MNTRGEVPLRARRQLYREPAAPPVVDSQDDLDLSDFTEVQQHPTGRVSLDDLPEIALAPRGNEELDMEKTPLVEDLTTEMLSVFPKEKPLTDEQKDAYRKLIGEQVEAFIGPEIPILHRELAVREAEVGCDFERIPRADVISGMRYRVDPRPIGKGGYGVAYVARAEAVESFDEQGNSIFLDIDPEDTHPIVQKYILIREPTGLYENYVQAEILALKKKKGNAADKSMLVDAKRYRTEDGKLVYMIAMEKVHDQNITQYQEQEKKKPEHVRHSPEAMLRNMYAFKAVLQELRELHAAGFQHRDVKPQNIMIDQNHPLQTRLIDLGLVNAQGVESYGVEGSPQYMTAEAFVGRVDPYRDVYAASLVFAEVLELMRRKKDLFSYGDLLLALQKGEFVESIETPHEDDSIEMEELSTGEQDGDVMDDADQESAEATPLFDKWRHQSARDMAQLLYEIVQPNAGMGERKPFGNIQLTIHRLDSIIQRQKIVVDAYAELEDLDWYTQRHRQGSDAADPFLRAAQQLEEAIESDDIDLIQQMRAQVKELFAQPNTERVLQVPEEKRDAYQFKSRAALVLTKMEQLAAQPEMRDAITEDMQYIYNLARYYATRRRDPDLETGFALLHAIETRLENLEAQIARSRYVELEQGNELQYENINMPETVQLEIE